MYQTSFKVIFLLGVALVLSGCSSRSGGSISAGTYSTSTQRASSSQNQSITHLQAVHRATLRPYSVFGVQYCPHIVSVGDTMSGVASWYGRDFHGKKTSSGEVYNMNELTAAHKTWPLHTVVRVDNLNNGKSVIVRINDRGPFLRDRVIDLSYAAARRIDMHSGGLANVRVTVLRTDSKNWPADAPRGTSTGVTSNECHLVNTSQQRVTQPASTSSTSQTVVQNEVFFVQVGAFSSFDGAIRFQQNSLNLPLSLDSKIDSRSGNYRVLVGGFRNEAEARDFIANSGYIGAFLVRERQ